MRGEQHVFYSLLSAVIFLPLIAKTGDPLFLLLISIGIFIGSLAPDADAADSAIMHGLSGGRGNIRTLRRHTVLVLPFFGYLIRYFIYFPVSLFVYIVTFGRVKPKHRGLLHSLFGIITASALLLIYITIISGLVSNLLELFIRGGFSDTNAGAITGITGGVYETSPGDFFSSRPEAVFCTGILAGAFLHLLEDSCTHSGVFWLFPFKNTKISGTIIPKSKRNWLIVLVLGTAASASLFAGINYQSPELYLKILPALIFILAWIVVLFISGSLKR